MGVNPNTAPPAWENLICSECGGDGWIIGHEDECYESGDCGCSGVQEVCPRCGGRGRLDG